MLCVLLLGMKRFSPWILALCVATALLRAYFLYAYYGWEESDYGNLAMVYGVWDSGFSHYDMNHMPGYYFFGALLYGVFGDSTVAAFSVSALAGILTLGVLGQQLTRWFPVRKGWLILAALLVQPEFVLYASSSLREPLYALFLILALQALLTDQHWKYGVWGALAFSVRFEAPLFLLPMLLCVPWQWKDRVKSLSVLVCAVSLWMVYCWHTYDSPWFWSHAAAVNVETGLGAEATKGWEWWLNGFSICWGLMVSIAPSHVGHGWMLAWLATPFIWRDSKKVLVCWWWSVLMTGVWLGIAFVAQHEVGHNLYWKWMYPLVPFWIVCAVLTVLRSSSTWLVWTVLIQGMVVQGIECKRQFDLSERLYGPQIRLAQWIEGNLDPSQPLLLDNVPACWLRRDENPFELHSWFDVPTFTTPDELWTWADSNDVEYVLFFREEWTQAPIKASFLLDRDTIDIDNQGRIVLLDEETEYGWKWYRLIKDSSNNPTLP